MASSCWEWWQSVSRAVMNMGHASPSSPSTFGRSSCAVTQWTWSGLGLRLGLGSGLGFDRLAHHVQQEVEEGVEHLVLGRGACDAE